MLAANIAAHQYVCHRPCAILTCVQNMSYHVHITSLLTDFHIRRWRAWWWEIQKKRLPDQSQFDHSSGSVTVAGANRSCSRQRSSFHLLQHCMFQWHPKSGSALRKIRAKAIFHRRGLQPGQSIQSRLSQTGSQTAEWHSASGQFSELNILC